MGILIHGHKIRKAKPLLGHNALCPNNEINKEEKKTKKTLTSYLKNYIYLGIFLTMNHKHNC